MRRRTAASVLAAALVLASCGGSDDGGTDPIREGRTVYADSCSSCHGSAGQGGVGPSLAGVLQTFPDCEDQIEWITLGSEGWEAEHGATYGAEAKPLDGGMPAHGDDMAGVEIRWVAAYQRVTYGGEDRAAALEGCGIDGG
ncbi:MAG: cytochrome c [Actinobacteria bacterium]|nr:cytochrome c [Actinomycetota bacterium]